MIDTSSDVMHWYSFAVFLGLGVYFLLLKPGMGSYDFIRRWVRTIERRSVRVALALLFFVMALTLFLTGPAPVG